MSKHFLISSFESGNHLIRETSLPNALSALETALGSSILRDVDVTNSGLPQNVQSVSDEDDYWPHPTDWFSQLRPYKVKNGILTIPVRGMLMHGVSITYGRYFTGYEYLVRALQRAMVDPEVKWILFHVDSPGGHVAGCFDFCDLLFSCEKPTVAFIADMACSGGYAIASQCNKVIGTQTCDTANIGVLSAYVDYSEALSKAGVKYHYVSAPEGGTKADGHFGAGVSKELLERTQAEANETYEIFVNCVARGRPLTPEQIRETRANSYRKEASLAMGLIDMVASSVDLVSVAAEVFAGFGEDDQPDTETVQTQEKGTEMTEEEKAALVAKSKGEGVTEGAAAAKARISKIVGSNEAKGREALAQHFAFNTDIDADTAISSMAVAPLAAAPVAPESKPDDKKDDKQDDKMSKSFDEQMQKHAPNLSPDKKSDDEKDKATKSLESSMALAKSAGIGGYNYA